MLCVINGLPDRPDSREKYILNISNRDFVVTGAARGLGEAISYMLAGHGARIALLDVDPAGLEEVSARCREAGAADCATIECNVADEASVEAAFADAVARLGPLSGLVNNAGVLRDALLVKASEGEIVDRMSLSDWQQVIDVNLTGVFLCGREAAGHMVGHGEGGVIINVSSISRAGNMGQSNYAAAKSGVAALVTTWARELARHGIRCAGIAPGVFETEMVASMKPEAYERITAAVPLGRTGSVEELAQAIRFIIEHDYFTGRILELDGGLRL